MQWVSLLAHSSRVSGSILSSGLSVWHFACTPWITADFLPLSENMPVGELVTNISPFLRPSVRICVWMMMLCDRLVSYPEYIPASCPLFPGYTPHPGMTQPRTRHLLRMNECILSVTIWLRQDQFKPKSLHGLGTIDLIPFHLPLWIKTHFNQTQSQSEP